MAPPSHVPHSVQSTLASSRFGETLAGFFLSRAGVRGGVRTILYPDQFPVASTSAERFLILVSSFFPSPAHLPSFIYRWGDGAPLGLCESILTTSSYLACGNKYVPGPLASTRVDFLPERQRDPRQGKRWPNFGVQATILPCRWPYPSNEHRPAISQDAPPPKATIS